MRTSEIIQTKGQKYFSTNEIGPLLGVSPRTIRNWVKQGQIKADRVGHRLKISKKEAVRILRQYEQPIPEEWQW